MFKSKNVFKFKKLNYLFQSCGWGYLLRVLEIAHVFDVADNRLLVLIYSS